jgi:hypothetical protein
MKTKTTFTVSEKTMAVTIPIKTGAITSSDDLREALHIIIGATDAAKFTTDLLKQICDEIIAAYSY